jgi:hypothetical protein
MKNKGLGLYLSIGGLWGLFILLRKAFTISLNSNQIMIAFLFIILYILVTISGILMILDKRQAKYLVLVLLLIQTFQFALGDFSFAFIGGTYIGIEIRDGINFIFEPLYAFFELSFEPHSIYYVDVNFVPIVIIGVYHKYFKIP